MIEESVSILLVEDDEAHAELIQRSFEYRGDAVILHIAPSLSEARSLLNQLPHPPALIIADWRLPDGDSLDLLNHPHPTSEENLHIPIVIMTSQGNERVAVNALKSGALDYVVKSQETLMDMPHIAERALRQWRITAEHERMSEALRQSEAQFRLLAENATDMITRHGLDGRCLYISPACRGLLDYEPDELLGLSVFDFIHPDDLPEIRAHIGDLLNVLVLRGVIMRVRRKDGRYVWVETNSRVVPDPETDKLEIHSASRDVTDRVKAEQELRASEDRFRSLVQNSDDLIHVIDVNGRIVYESPSVLRITGYLPGEMLGKNPLDYIHPEDIQIAHNDLMGVVARTEQGTATEVRFRRADGEWIYLEVMGSNLLDHPGIRGIVLTSRDITLRKRSELALHQAHENLTAAYDDTILGWSRAMDLRDKETEGHTLRVTEVTVALAEALGISGGMLQHIRRGALLHDIGKMGVPDDILQKPAPLTPDEWVVMRKHPEYAYKMLVDIEYLRPALNIPYYHHEHWDGKGYPRQLKGEEIPLEARLFAVVDVWDALSFDRPYRKGWPQEQVLAYLVENRGSHFDPHIVDVFLTVLAQKFPGDPHE
jgi:PAS domain S-box-containing protein/putative nucleotidyltransferase with HDIG domain